MFAVNTRPALNSVPDLAKGWIELDILPKKYSSNTFTRRRKLDLLLKNKLTIPPMRPKDLAMFRAQEFPSRTPGMFYTYVNLASLTHVRYQRAEEEFAPSSEQKALSYKMGACLDYCFSGNRIGVGQKRKHGLRNGEFESFVLTTRMYHILRQPLDFVTRSKNRGGGFFICCQNFPCCHNAISRTSLEKHSN